MTEETVTKKLLRWPYLLTGVLCMLFSGILYAWSILKAPLAAEFGWTAPDLALNFTITMCFFCIGGVVSGFLSKKTSPRVTTIIAAVLTLGGFLITSIMDGTSLFVLYLSYGVLGGLGIGMAYNAVISAVNAWFPDRKGLCSGLLMMGFGVSTLVLGNLAASMIADVNVGWRTTYMIMAIALGIILLITAFIIRLPKPGTQFPQPKAKKSEHKEDFEVVDMPPAKLVKRFTFWRFFIYTTLLAAVGNAVISCAKDIAMSAGAAETLAITLVGVFSISNGVGRVICGAMFDALGRKKTMLFANTVTIIAPVLLLLSVSMGSVALCTVGLCLTGISYGCAPTITSAFVGSFYGMKYFGINFSITNMTLIPTSFAATLASGLVTSTGSFVAPMIMLIACAGISLVMNLSIKRP